MIWKGMWVSRDDQGYVGIIRTSARDRHGALQVPRVPTAAISSNRRRSKWENI